MTPPPDPKPETRNPKPDLRYPALILLLAPLLLRATIGFEPLPGWDLDPLVYAVPISSLTPAGSLLIDALVLLGAALLLLNERRANRAVSPLAVALATIGTVPVLLHAFVLGQHDGSLGDARIGFAWTSAIWAALALSYAARDPQARRVATASLLGFVALLALRGAQQVFLEHPATVRSFLQTKDEFFASKGWAPDSPMARGYLRRLMQPDATGWFGLSNVYATFAAGGLAAALGAFIAAIAAKRDKLAIAITALLLAAAAAALYFSQSKGGVAAALFGIAALTTLLLVHRVRERRPDLVTPGTASAAAALVAISAVAVPIVAILVRAIRGERLSELSLLFRWFYFQAAARMIAADPLTGVGPDGFQRRYPLVKNPLSPEEVTSPHSILVDWTSTLGVCALAWCALFIWWVWRTGANAATAPTVDPTAREPDARAETRTVLAIAALSTLTAAWIERPALDPGVAFVRVLGLALWGWVGWGVLRALAPGPRTDRAATPFAILGLAAGALAMVAHAQIDVTASWPASAGVFFAFLALAAVARSVPAAAPLPRLAPVTGALVSAALAGLVLTAATRPAWQWQRHLTAAAEAVRPIAELSRRAQSLAAPSQPGAPREDPRALTADLAALLGHPVPSTPDGFRRGMAELEARLLPTAIYELESAYAVNPDDWRVSREASRLNLRLATALDPATQTPARAALDAALSSLHAPDHPGVAPVLRWLGTVHQQRAETLDRARELTLAAEAAEAAAAVDPYNPDHAYRLFELRSLLDQPDAARAAAARARELNALLRLDREARGLTDDQVRRLDEALRPPTPP